MQQPRSRVYAASWMVCAAMPASMAFSFARVPRDLLKCYIAANTHFENWPLLINKELFESLSAEDQKILLEKSAAFEARRWEVAEADQAAYEKKLEEAGWTVIRLTPEQQNAFAEKGRKASWPELKKAIGDKAYEEVISTFVLE